MMHYFFSSAILSRLWPSWTTTVPLCPPRAHHRWTWQSASWTLPFLASLRRRCSPVPSSRLAWFCPYSPRRSSFRLRNKATAIFRPMIESDKARDGTFSRLQKRRLSRLATVIDLEWLVTVLSIEVILELRKEETSQHFLSRFLVDVGLEREHGLRLVLAQPHRLQV